MTQIIEQEAAQVKFPVKALSKLDDDFAGAHPDVRDMVKANIQHEYDTRHVVLLGAVMNFEAAHDRHDEINLVHLEQMRDRLSRILDERMGKS